MSESVLFVLVIVAAGVFFGVIGLVASNASIRRLMGRSFDRGAMLILHERVPRALYFIGNVRGVDAARIKKGLAASDRRAFVWMSQAGRAGDPGRALLLDALTEVIAEGEVRWPGSITPEVENAVRRKLDRVGVELGSLRLAGEVELDDDARARHAWWVCYVQYESVAGQLCCDGLEFWLDAQGPGLWSLKTRTERLTSVQVAAQPDFHLSCHAAHDLPSHLLGGPLKDKRQLRLADMTTRP